jgi:PAS domain S-box
LVCHPSNQKDSSVRSGLSIRLKLLFLAVLASLPALGLVLRSGMLAERQALHEAEISAAHLTRNLSLRQQQYLDSSRQFLATLALLPPVRRLDGEATAPLFRTLLAANPIYSDIILSKPDGHLLASARTGTPNLSLAEAPYFAQVLATREFTVGGYRKSLTTGLDVLVCAYPVLGPRHELIAVISTGVRLNVFDDIVRDIQLPEGSTVFLADRDGRRLYNRHYPTPRPDLYPLGEPVTLSRRQLLRTAAQESPFYAPDLKGQRRLYVVLESRLSPEDAPYLYVGVSLPQSTIIGQARGSLLSGLAMLLTAALLAGLAAWLAGRKIFVERIERLAEVAGRFARGELTARTGLSAKSAGRDELGQLVLAMDRIGEELSAREAEREATLERLRRTQFAMDHAGEDIYWVDETGRFLYMNERAARSLGYTPDELKGLTVFDVDAQIGPVRWREFLTRLGGAGSVTFETSQRTRNGGRLPKEITMSLVAGGGAQVIFATGRDIRERKRQEAVLRSLLDETASVTGQEFFRAFTARIVSLLDVYAAFLGEYPEAAPGMVRPLSLSSGHDQQPTYDFAMQETPGADIPDDGYLLISEGVRQRYPDSGILARLGVESYLGVPLHDASGRRIGHMSIMDRRPMPEDPLLIATLRLFAQRASAELVRLRAERELRASLKEKEVLLKEIHHRVKNNLQIVSSLLSLQARDVSDPAVLELLAQSRSRILSMALVHEDLYQSGNLAQVDFRHYLERLAERTRTGIAAASGVVIAADMDPLALPIDQAIPLGLLCNELLTNALKHAFKGRAPGTVRLLLRAAEGGGELTVRDDGVGLPEDFRPGAGGTLGMELVWTLAEQLHGHVEAQSDGGAVFTVRFPLA